MVDLIQHHHLEHRRLGLADRSTFVLSSVSPTVHLFLPCPQMPKENETPGSEGRRPYYTFDPSEPSRSGRYHLAHRQFSCYTRRALRPSHAAGSDRSSV